MMLDMLRQTILSFDRFGVDNFLWRWTYTTKSITFGQGDQTFGHAELKSSEIPESKEIWPLVRWESWDWEDLL